MPCSISLVKPETPFKYLIIGCIEEEIRFEKAKQEVTLSIIQRIINEESFKEIIDQLKDVSPIFVTGSSGYFGSADVQTLREHNILPIGSDLIDSPTTDFIDSVSDINIVRKASSQGCKSIIHTAAVHAPNLDFYSEHDYQKVNVEETRNILSCAKKFQMKALVFHRRPLSRLPKRSKNKKKIKIVAPQSYKNLLNIEQHQIYTALQRRLLKKSAYKMEILILQFTLQQIFR